MIKNLAVILFLFCLLVYGGFSLVQNHASLYAMDSVEQKTIDKLSKAILENNFDLVKQIINNGININQKNSDGKYPLEMVLIMGNCEMAELLLKHGANPYVITTSGQSIYDIVMNNSSKMMKKIFEKAGKNYTKYTVDQLSMAVLENDINTVNKIIESKTVNINQRDSNGKYPLEMVLVMGNCDMARILLGAGADPHVNTKSGKSIYNIVMNDGSKTMKSIFKEYK